MKRLTIVSVLFSQVLLFSCSSGPEPILFGQDACHHCKMTIMDNHFGAEIITAKGKVFKFDAAECMANFLHENGAELKKSGNTFLTVDYASPGVFVDATKASFLKDKAVRSPMGGNLSSFNSLQAAKDNRKSADGIVLSWEELLNNY
ncbi:nitrous oxide reductase accessory protein NosL [Rubrolithibacter danxiaensis]|uniref:nitrous oxide reductase accessory protein NosL n=1 Tax=Rubrolithibacter danxiaensis TaxID=3390805 RepID=UPI003BF77D78